MGESGTQYDPPSVVSYTVTFYASQKQFSCKCLGLADDDDDGEEKIQGSLPASSLQLPRATLDPSQAFPRKADSTKSFSTDLSRIHRTYTHTHTQSQGPISVLQFTLREITEEKQRRYGKKLSFFEDLKGNRTKRVEVRRGRICKIKHFH